MSKNVRGTPAGTPHARTTHRLCNEHGDGTVAGKRPKGCAGPDEKRVIVYQMPAVLDVGDDRIANLLSHWQQRLAAAFADNTNHSVPIVGDSDNGPKRSGSMHDGRPISPHKSGSHLDRTPSLYQVQANLPPVRGSGLDMCMFSSSGPPTLSARQKKSWVDSGSGSLPSE